MDKSKHTGLGIALGAGLGTAFGVLAGNIAVWLAVGVALGMILGASFRSKPSDCPQYAATHPSHAGIQKRPS